MRMKVPAFDFACSACAWVCRSPDAVLGKLDDLFERLRSPRFQDAPLAALLLAPALALIGLFGMAPLVLAISMSLHRGKGIHREWAGLSQYVRALGSPEFWSACSVTLYYVVGTVPVALAASFVVASALRRITRGRSLFRTTYFLPYVTSIVAAAMIWRAILHAEAGLLNTALGFLGLPEEVWPRWLLEPRGALHVLTGGRIPASVGPSLALCCVIVFDIWHASGFMIVILLAGLSAVPREMEEAAMIDGAGWLQRTRHIVLPLISPTLFFLLIVSTIKAFQAFNSFYALTGGRGPLDSTQNLTVYIFANLYEYPNLSYGAAVAVLLATAIVLLTLLQWRLLGRRIHYE